MMPVIVLDLTIAVLTTLVMKIGHYKELTPETPSLNKHVTSSRKT